MRNVKLAIGVVFGLAVITCGMDQPTSRSFPKVLLEAFLSGDEQNPVLTIRLRNTGDAPIVVDKELVFLPDIVLLDNERCALPFKEIRAIQKPVVSVLKSRLVTLKPGEEIEREVNLRKGFKRFVTGISIPARPDTGETPRVTAYEALCQIPPNVRPFEIQVSYKPWYSFEEGFAVYMQGISIAHFYRGPLHVSVPYRFTKDTGGGHRGRQGTEDGPN